MGAAVAAQEAAPRRAYLGGALRSAYPPPSPPRTFAEAGRGLRQGVSRGHGLHLRIRDATNLPCDLAVKREGASRFSSGPPRRQSPG